MKKNTGKYLEAITASIEKALIDNPNTSIERNMDLSDRDDVKREVDIYVETVVNKKKLKYAIECKEFKGKTRVEIKHVSDFYDKIANQGIKGIIITTSDFRKNAVKKANNLNIDTYKIIENPNPLIKGYKLINQRHKIHRAQILSSHFSEFEKPNLKFIYMGTKKKRYTYEGFMKGYLINETEKMIQQNRKELFSEFVKETDNGIQWDINSKKSRTFFGLLDMVYFKQKNKYYPIEKWQVNLTIWIDYIEEENPNSFIYFDATNNNKVANFLARSIEISSGVKGYMNLIELADSKDLKFDFVTNNPKDQKHVKLHDFGTFKEGEFEIKIDEEE